MSDLLNQWESYRRAELARAMPLLVASGIELDAEQVHIGGERHLHSRHKIVLTGTFRGVRAVIKVSSTSEGVGEIQRDHDCREMLHSLNFAYRPFLSPKELLFQKNKGVVVLVTEYIAEKEGFLSLSLPEQFTLALKALEAQEGLQATTFKHARSVRKTFGMADAGEYIRSLADFAARATASLPQRRDVHEAYAECGRLFRQHAIDIERYCGFLTHADFVPHNFRVSGKDIYLLDHTSLRFGNKHESWGRLVNYMVLYNPELAGALAQYVRDNRSEEENLSFKLMRLYKLGFLLAFYAENVVASTGNLQTLAEHRIDFWLRVLTAVLRSEDIPDEVRNEYISTRDTLRSEDEKRRQQVLNQL